MVLTDNGLWFLWLISHGIKECHALVILDEITWLPTPTSIATHSLSAKLTLEAWQTHVFFWRFSSGINLTILPRSLIESRAYFISETSFSSVTIAQHIFQQVSDGQHTCAAESKGNHQTKIYKQASMGIGTDTKIGLSQDDEESPLLVSNPPQSTTICGSSSGTDTEGDVENAADEYSPKTTNRSITVIITALLIGASCSYNSRHMMGWLTSMLRGFHC